MSFKKTLGEGNGNPIQHTWLENPMDRGAWKAAVHGVARSWTRLSDFIFTFHVHALEKEMATHSSVLAWRIPGIGEPGGLPSLGSDRVGHDWSDLATAAAARKLRELVKLLFINLTVLFVHNIVKDWVFIVDILDLKFIEYRKFKTNNYLTLSLMKSEYHARKF